jgi:hypothetical protein
VCPKTLRRLEIKTGWAGKTFLAQPGTPYAPPELILVGNAKKGELRFGSTEFHEMYVCPMLDGVWHLLKLSLDNVFILSHAENGGLVREEGVPKVFYLIELYAKLAHGSVEGQRTKGGTLWCAACEFGWVWGGVAHSYSCCVLV